MRKINYILNKLLLCFFKRNKKFPNKKKLLDFYYPNEKLKKVVGFIINNQVEEAVATYSQFYKEINGDIKWNNGLFELLSHAKTLKKFLKFKTRYFEFLISLINHENKNLISSFYGINADNISKVRNALTLSNENEECNNFFMDRMEEWKLIFEKDEIPYLTKSILFREIEMFNTNTNEQLFKGLETVTPLYFLRKMQLPNLSEFISLIEILKHFEEKKKIKILDYGCGAADLSLYCAMNNYEVTICDIKNGNLKAAKKRFDIRALQVDTVEVNYLEPIPEINGTFDLIIALEVIEHVREPMKLLKLFNQVIKRNGIIMLGSFPFKDTYVKGDHLVESVSQRRVLLDYIHLNWEKYPQQNTGNTFLKV